MSGLVDLPKADCTRSSASVPSFHWCDFGLDRDGRNEVAKAKEEVNQKPSFSFYCSIFKFKLPIIFHGLETFYTSYFWGPQGPCL